MIEVLKQALEALEDFVDVIKYDNEQDDIGRRACCDVLSYNPHSESCKAKQAITAIKAAIREHAMYEVQRLGQEIEQEPVAKVFLTETLKLPCLQWLDLNRQFDFKGGEYLYTHPPQRTWVGLTDEEIEQLELTSATSTDVREIQAKLKQKNGFAEEKNNG